MKKAKQEEIFPLWDIELAPPTEIPQNVIEELKAHLEWLNNIKDELIKEYEHELQNSKRH